MKYLDYPEITDPRLNLAVEEYLFRHSELEEALLFLYVNAPSVLVGRNQNVFEEIDFDFIRETGIPVIRRLSGGGTVYHDLGNLNFSLITPDKALLNNYEAFTAPVISALEEMGLTAELRNRSSLFVGEKKISGNAQYASAGRLVSHGTLLVDTNLDQLRRSISPGHQHIESRAVQSVRSSVANLSYLLGRSIGLLEIKRKIKNAFLDSDTRLAVYRLSDQGWKDIRSIAGERYQSWGWNVGRSPQFKSRRQILTEVGNLIIEVHVKNGVLSGVEMLQINPQIEDEFAGLCAFLIGTRYDRTDIAAAIGSCGRDLMAAANLSESDLTALFY